jgi:hypothetical protein
MAPKKAKQLKEGEVDYLDEFTRKYRKSMRELELPKLPDVDRILNVEIPEYGDDIPFWCLKQEEMDTMSYRNLMACLALSGYNKFKALRLWNTGGGDEVVRNTCVFIDSACQKPLGEGLAEVQLTGCDITPLGCQFIARSLGAGGNINIQCLKLDFNQFGSAGLKELAVGLAVNQVLQRLDLNYCGIDGEGGQYLFQILINCKSQLTTMELRGNELGNTGFLEMARGLKIAKKLVAIDLADNRITEEPDVLEAFVQLFKENKVLGKYNLVGNFIFDTGMAVLIQGLMGLTHVQDVFAPEECKPTTLEALETALGKAAAGGKKGKKKK